MSLPSSLHPALADAITAREYDTLTQVQNAVIEDETAGRDLLVSAQTGSGKTVAFGLAMAADILGDAPKFGKGGAPLALIVAPTRELAMQVKRELEWLYAPANAKIASCVGGMDQRDERRVLAGGVHIVVGTPGRLSDHIKRNNLDTSEIKTVVLDEADEMLDMGFREELEHILEGTPDTRRTLMFSATVPKGIASMAKKFQKDALRITTDAERSQHLDIEYKALYVAPGDEENAIVNIVRHSESESALVFCTTRAAVNRLMSRMGNRGFPVVALSGELSQKERTNALNALRSGRARVCIATDVAARGLDLQNLGLVIHADLPRDPATLLHRSGRTGRAGRKGVSALLVPPRGARRVERLLRDAGIEASWGKPPTADEINALDDARLLADPGLSRPVHESEADMIKALLEQHGAEQVAAAFLRKSREGRSAPEDLRDVDSAPPPRSKDRPERGERSSFGDRDDRPRREKRPKQDRKGFEDSKWVSLSVGRKQSAEARWILPMICKAGDLSREDIGAIRINPGDTHVEMTPEGARKFFDALSSGAKLDKGIRAEAMGGAPSERPDFEDAPRPHKSKPYAKRAPYDPDKAPRAEKKPYKKKEDRAVSAPAEHVPSLDDYIQHDGPTKKKPFKKKPMTSGGKGGNKPPFKKSKGKPFAGKPAKKKTRD